MDNQFFDYVYEEARGKKDFGWSLHSYSYAEPAFTPEQQRQLGTLEGPLKSPLFTKDII